MTVGLSIPTFATEQTYVREYSYQASEADSKLTARSIALQEIKRELLSELGTHVTALVKIESSSDGSNLGKEEIETLSAGVTHVEILDEKWNGVVYILKAQIKADPEEVLKNLYKILDAEKKQKQISQLNSDLSKLQTERIQIAESLTQSKNETTKALAEIARLKLQLEEKNASRQTIQEAYIQQVGILDQNALFDSALSYYTKEDYSNSLQLFQKAADQGHAGAQNNLGIMFAEGKGVERNSERALYWLTKAAEQGNAGSQYNLGLAYTDGRFGKSDPELALYWYQLAAKQGFVYAQYNLGMMFAEGVGGERNPEQALYWFEMAANQGHSGAQNNLGAIFNEGVGVDRDIPQAFHWFTLAAEQGNAQAQYNLGGMYLDGKAVARDSKRAANLYRKAAEQGYDYAQFKLGEMYLDGKGVIQNPKLALHWFKKAGEQGLVYAQNYIGWIYSTGNGTPIDLKKAKYWYQKAADQGSNDARNALATMINK